MSLLEPMQCEHVLTCVTVLCKEGWTTGVIGGSPKSPLALHNVVLFYTSELLLQIHCIFQILPNIPMSLLNSNQRPSRDGELHSNYTFFTIPMNDSQDMYLHITNDCPSTVTVFLFAPNQNFCGVLTGSKESIC